MIQLLKKIIRFLRKTWMIVLYWPHLIVYKTSKNRSVIEQDIIVNAF